MTLKIEVGKTYRRRDGAVDTIVAFDDEDGTEGEFATSESPFDLIEEVPAPESEYAEWIGRDVPEGIDADNPPREVEVMGSGEYFARNNPGFELTAQFRYRIKRSLIPTPTPSPKQPKPGEWWECSFEGSSQVALLVGKNADGDNVWETRSHGVLANVEPVRHLPHCTGFDYVIPVAEKPNAPCAFDGAGWYRLRGGKCVELDENRCCSVGCGLIDEWGESLSWLWDLDGTAGGVTPDSESIENWHLAEKLDGPPPELPERFAHLHPAESRVPDKGEQYLLNTGLVVWATSDRETRREFNEGRRWIVRESESPATKKITLRRWLHKHGDQWHLTLWQEQPPRMASGEPIEYGKSKIVEVPDAP